MVQYRASNPRTWYDTYRYEILPVQTYWVSLELDIWFCLLSSYVSYVRIIQLNKKEQYSIHSIKSERLFLPKDHRYCPYVHNDICVYSFFDPKIFLSPPKNQINDDDNTQCRQVQKQKQQTKMTTIRFLTVLLSLIFVLTTTCLSETTLSTGEDVTTFVKSKIEEHSVSATEGKKKERVKVTEALLASGSRRKERLLDEE